MSDASSGAPGTPTVPGSGSSAPGSGSSAGSAVIDLLGLVAYGELLAFDRMAADARLAPDLDRRAVLSEMAAVEIIN